LAGRQQAPGERDDGGTVDGEDFLLNPGSVLEREEPLRPGLGFEFGDARRAVRVHHVRRIKL